MAHTSSITDNRVTVSITWDQRRYIKEGAARFRIGFSEYLRRLLDKEIHGNTIWISEQKDNK